MKDFLAVNFREHFKSIKEEQNLRKVTKLLYIFLTTPDEVENHVQSNTSDSCIPQCNVKTLSRITTD